MIFKINWEEYQGAIDNLQDLTDAIEEFTSIYTKINTEIANENKGEYFSKINSQIEKQIDVLNKKKEVFTDIRASLIKYEDLIEDTDPWSGNGEYYIDTETINRELSKLEKRLKFSIDKNGFNFGMQKQHIENKISRFNKVDPYIDEYTEYENDVEAIKLISTNREIIKTDISNYEKNLELINNVKSIVSQMESDLKDLI